MRAANIRTSTGLTNRPIVRLIPLEVSTHSACGELSCEKNFDSTNDSKADAVTEVAEPRPTRHAAKKAQDRMMQWANILSLPPGGCHRQLTVATQYS